MTVYVKEIPCLRLHPKHINDQVVAEPQIYNLLLPHLYKDFRNTSDNFVAISCFPPFPYNDDIENKYCEYIKENLVDNNTKIVFDNVYEGHTVSCINGIHKIIQRLNLNSKNCYFVSGGMEAQKFYDDFCKEKNIENKINIIILNSWERHLSIDTIRQKLNNSEFNTQNREKLFLCFNRVWRIHRAFLLGLLYNKDLVKDSYYSYFPNLTHGGELPPTLDSVKDCVSDKTFLKIKNQLTLNKNHFPLNLNNQDGKINTNVVIPSDMDYYQNSYFSLVTETFFFDKSKEYDHIWEERSVFFSEKIFKPIICKHPFIIVSRPNSLEYLKKIGYKTFHPYIDESYDNIDNDEKRLLAIVEEVERLSKQDNVQWREWLQNVKPIVEHNHNIIINKTVDDYHFKG